MFTHPVLNRTFVVKHHPRHGEFEFGADRGAIVTKVIFPFDPDDLDLGGQFILIDDPDLVDQLERYLDYREYDIERDVAVLEVAQASCRQLDPFLLFEALICQQDRGRALLHFQPQRHRPGRDAGVRRPPGRRP